ncbi:MAG: dihydroorotate dehydrogenase [Rhodobacter sp.]
MQDTDLEGLFATARAQRPIPSAGLAERIIGQADAVQAGFKPAPIPARRRRWPGWIVAMGGNGVLAGLATAALAGLWLGFAQPAPVLTLTLTMREAFAADAGPWAIELIPSLDAFGLEG